MMAMDTIATVPLDPRTIPESQLLPSTGPSISPRNAPSTPAPQCPPLQGQSPTACTLDPLVLQVPAGTRSPLLRHGVLRGRHPPSLRPVQRGVCLDLPSKLILLLLPTREPQPLIHTRAKESEHLGEPST